MSTILVHEDKFFRGGTGKWLDVDRNRDRVFTLAVISLNLNWILFEYLSEVPYDEGITGEICSLLGPWFLADGESFLHFSWSVVIGH